MHNLTKIKIFRWALWITYPFALVLILPLVYLRRKHGSGLFFFFDRYAIGGAQRIHLDILESVQDISKQVYFTRKSPNDTLKPDFYSVPNTENRDIHFWCDYLFFRLFSVHYYAFYLNRHTNARVLSANSTFFYDLLPFLKKEVIAIELLHNFSYGKNGMEFFGLANYKRLNYRIVYDRHTLLNIQRQYAEYGIDRNYLDKILFIEPGVNIPEPVPKPSTAVLQVLYAGRGGPQKRVWLLNRIIEKALDEQLPVHFHFAGPMEDELTETVKRAATLHGQVGSKDEMNAIYSAAHLIILTSAYEGFPMVIKEGMAYGCVPLVTALEGNKMHLQHGVNALLIDAIEDEDKVVEEGIELLRSICGKPEQLRELAQHAYHYAKAHFSKPEFMQRYHAFLINCELPPTMVRDQILSGSTEHAGT